MASTWPTTKSTGDTIPADEWNGIVDFGVEKPSSAALVAGRVIFSNGTNAITTGNLQFDSGNSRLSVGHTTTPNAVVHAQGNVAASNVPALAAQNFASDAGSSCSADFSCTSADTATRVGVRLAAIRTTAGALHELAISMSDGAWTLSERCRILDTGELGLGVAAPDTILHLGGNAAALAITWDEDATTPANPTAGAQMRVYMKADKLIIQFNDAGTVRYKYLDLTGTGVTWVHTTSAP